MHNIIFLDKQPHLHAAVGATGEESSKWIHIHLANALPGVLEESVFGMFMRERIDQHELVHVPYLQYKSIRQLMEYKSEL